MKNKTKILLVDDHQIVRMGLAANIAAEDDLCLVVESSDGGESVNQARKLAPDVILMDPPRTGSTPEFIESACRTKPERIVYVSCNPETLARDLKLFKGFNYRMREASPFDNFPLTEHVETVALLQRSNA